VGKCFSSRTLLWVDECISNALLLLMGCGCWLCLLWVPVGSSCG